MIDLAGANLERLVLQTQYTAETIADWVDTALLRSHLSTAMIGYLAKVNISTATDLILACCVAQNTGFWYEVRTSERARKAMVTDWQVGAMKGANTVAQTVVGVGKLSKDDVDVASLDQALRYALASFAPEHNLSNILHFRLSTLKQPITSDPRLAEICDGLNRLMEISGLDIKDDVDGSKFKANAKDYVENIRKCIETFSFGG